jgi:uncharacterized protein (DUF2062 family)
MKKIRHKMLDFVTATLRQGLSPREASLAVASGTTLSLFPVPGTTTLLTLAVARLFGLNIVVSQAANWLASPLQVILLVPFMKAGAWMLGIDSSVLSPEMLARISAEGILPVIGDLGVMLIAGAAAWVIAATPLFFVVYGCSLLAFRLRTSVRPATGETGAGM